LAVPACAGVSPGINRRNGKPRRRPRLRGGEPLAVLVTLPPDWPSPPARGEPAQP